MAEKINITLKLHENTLQKSVKKAHEDAIESSIAFPLAELQEKWQVLARQVEHLRSRHMTTTVQETSDDETDYRENARALGQQLFNLIFDNKDAYADFRNAIPKKSTG